MLKQRIKEIIFFWLTVSLSACASKARFAPVSEASTIESLPKKGIYHVIAGETLYSIAWRYGLDYRDIAQRNHLKHPYHVQTGQTLYLTKYAPVHKTKLITPAKPIPLAPSAHIVNNQPAPLPHRVEQEPHQQVVFWRWPAHGPVIGGFSAVNKGITITGDLGDPIVATAAGKVVYSGHGLRGYGNLIIIKHNSKFLSAYAHNKKVFVKEGDWVKNGQKIAEMGSTDARRTLLYFEIRRDGQPVNPLIYLTHQL